MRKGREKERKKKMRIENGWNNVKEAFVNGEKKVWREGRGIEVINLCYIRIQILYNECAHHVWKYLLIKRANKICSTFVSCCK